MLLQFAGYCLTSDASQQKMLLLTGPGGTGKSTILNMIQAIVGSENTSNVPLSSIATNRFSTAPMFGKLLNCNGDQKISALEDVSLVKQLVGEDVVNAEFKGKDQFSFRSYAKQIFSVNGFPLIKGEASDAIYRRLLILEVAKKPSRLDPDFQAFLLEEIDDFLILAVKAVERMYSHGRILESKRSEELVQEYRRRSDTVAAFLSDAIEESGQSDYIRKQVLFDEYVKYCAENERTPLKKKAFLESMHIKGYPEKTLDGNKVFRGLKFKDSGFVSVGKEQIPF
jgi:P4 family phage/plasmid primase-like protien